jgi:hypothetical protein
LSTGTPTTPVWYAWRSVTDLGGNVNITPVPEPEGLALVLAGLGAMGLLGWRPRLG